MRLIRWIFVCEDLYIGGGYEDLEGEDDLKSEFICPFCAEVFDIVGLCCHIDEEHPVEAKNGVNQRTLTKPFFSFVWFFDSGLSFVKIVTNFGFLI